MATRLEELREKYDESTLLALDPKPIQEKASRPDNQDQMARYADWCSRTSEAENEEMFRPRPEYEQDRARYEPIAYCDD